MFYEKAVQIYVSMQSKMIYTESAQCHIICKFHGYSR